MQAVKVRCREGFTVGVRINGKEWGTINATTSAESQGFAKIFQNAGADFISVTGYGYGFGNNLFWMLPDQVQYPQPPKHLVKLAKTIRKPGAFVPRNPSSSWNRCTLLVPTPSTPDSTPRPSIRVWSWSDIHGWLTRTPRFAWSPTGSRRSSGWRRSTGSDHSQSQVRTAPTASRERPTGRPDRWRSR